MAFNFEELRVRSRSFLDEEWADRVIEALKSLEVTNVVGGRVDNSGTGQTIVIDPVAPDPDKQWNWSVKDGKFCFERNGGYVYVPYFDGDGSGRDEDQVPTFMQFPVVPTIGGVSVLVTDEEDVPPELTLTNGQKNLIVCNVPLTARDELIGNNANKIEADLSNFTLTGETADGGGQTINITGSTGGINSGSGDAHTHSAGTLDATDVNAHKHGVGTLAIDGNATVLVPLVERNWHWSGVAPTITAVAEADFLSDGDAETVKILMGWVELDADGNQTDALWMIGHDAIQVMRNSHATSSETSAPNHRNPTPLNELTGGIPDATDPPVPGTV